MTTEEKAKAYDEALRKIRPLYEQAKKEDCPIWSTYEYIFPELAESEDEGIRKELIDAFAAYDIESSWNGIPVSSVLAWLEKQKEQKPADEQFPPLEGLDAIKAKYYDDGFKNGFDEGVASVKPAEWSEEDKVMLNNIIWGVHMKSIKPLDEMDDRSEYKKYENFLKFLPERFNLQPKQECGEKGVNGPQEIGDWRGDEGVCKKQKEQKPVEHYWEQMEWADIDIDEFTENVRHLITDKLTTSIPSVGGGTLTSTVFIDDKTAKEIANGILFFIGPQKPAEWSEEDKRKLNRIYEILGYAADDKGFLTSKRIIGDKEAIELQDFLKSLRPQPKAELTLLDENIIKAAVAFVEQNDHLNAWGGIDKHTVIKSLRSLRPQPREEIYQSAKHDLAIRFMNYLDENRPDGKMGLSNGECEDIDKAFKENDWAKIMKYVEKYRPSWKPSEDDIKMLEHIIGQYETGNKNSKVMGYLPRIEELNFLKNVLTKWKNLL